MKQIAHERSRVASIPMADSKAINAKLKELDDAASKAEESFYGVVREVKPPHPRRPLSPAQRAARGGRPNG